MVGKQPSQCPLILTTIDGWVLNMSLLWPSRGGIDQKNGPGNPLNGGSKKGEYLEVFRLKTLDLWVFSHDGERIVEYKTGFITIVEAGALPWKGIVPCRSCHENFETCRRSDTQNNYVWWCKKNFLFWCEAYQPHAGFLMSGTKLLL